MALDRGGIIGHPKGLFVLFFTELWERFSYYGMRAILILFMVARVEEGGLGLNTPTAASIYGIYTFGVYFTSIPGGWIADRILGLRRAVLIGGVLIALGHYSLAIRSTPVFYAGLCLIVCGVGLLKPNISSMVGQLYAEGDVRRDAGFSIFYMGINLGALISPFVVGFLAQDVRFPRLMSHLGLTVTGSWHWGFAAAGVGMTFGLIQYVLGWKRLGDVGREVKNPAAFSWSMLWAVPVLTVITVVALSGLGTVWKVGIFAGGFLAGALAWLGRQGFTTLERRRVLAIGALFVFSSLFWAAFEQAGSSLNLFADRFMRHHFLSFQFPSSWLQSVNSIFIVFLFAPFFAWFWVWLGEREPSSPAKFTYGLLFAGLGFAVVALAAKQFERTHLPVSPLWLVGVYCCHSIGEVCLSPVGLSTVTKLAPSRIVGQMMGVWFLSIALGNFIGGQVAGFFERFPLPQLFAAVFLTSCVSALILTFLVRPIRELMGGVH